MYEFKSSHAALIKRYIMFKRGLGYKFQYECTFSQFDRLLHDNDVRELGLTREICDKWAERRPDETEASQYQRIGLIHNFAVYMQGLGYKTLVPEHTFRFRTTFTPHIFTRSELEKFFEALDRAFYEPRTSPAYPALFRVLYGCGLRSCEVIALQIKDVDMLGRSITVNGSKNGESRILPVADSLLEVLFAYKSAYRADADAGDYFFVTQHENHMPKNSVYAHFRKILREAGIPHGGRGTGPRIHDFRHSFAVHSLEQAIRSGQDIYYCLPVISRYLGHKSIQATEAYLRLTSEIFPGLISEVSGQCGYIFPEAAKNEND